MIFFSYYPTYGDLDNLLNKYNNIKQLNIFVDLKNCLTGMYYEESLSSMVSSNMGSNQPIGDLVSSWFDFVMFHYKYMVRIKMPIHIFCFADVGKSEYHHNIYKEYKQSRSITNWKTLSAFEEDASKAIIKKNIESICNCSNKLYNCHGIYLNYCESDFVPHYLIKNHFNNGDFLNVIYSSDNDMIQSTILTNTLVFFRKNKDNKQFFDSSNWSVRYKVEDINLPISSCIFLKCLNGDTSDDIPGVKGIGPKKASDILKCVGEVESLDDFKKKLEENYTNEKIKKLIIDNWDIMERNYKLMSYDAIIDNISLNNFDRLQLNDTVEKFGLKESVYFINKMKERLGG